MLATANETADVALFRRANKRAKLHTTEPATAVVVPLLNLSPLMRMRKRREDLRGHVEERAPACLRGKFAFTGSVLGMGSYATVHEAAHYLTGQAVAIKEIARDNDRNKRLASADADCSSSSANAGESQEEYDEPFPPEDFERETATLRALYGCAGVVTMHECFADVFHRRCWIVMERMDMTLQSWLQYVKAGERRRAAWQLTAQLAKALAAVHGAGFAHRDVKPANVLLSAHPDHRDAPVKLADFGLARAMPNGNGAACTPATPRVVTQPYRAPELLTLQLLGARHGYGYGLREAAYDGPAVDVWSLACIAYQLHVGGVEPLFVSSTHPEDGGRFAEAEDADPRRCELDTVNTGGELYTLRHIVSLVDDLPPLAAAEYAAACRCAVCNLTRRLRTRDTVRAAASALPGKEREPLATRLQRNNWTLSNCARKRGPGLTLFMAAGMEPDPAKRLRASDMALLARNATVH